MAGLLKELAAAAFELPFDGFWLTGIVKLRLSGHRGRRSKLRRTSPVSYFLDGLATVLNRYNEADAYFARSAAMCDRMGASSLPLGMTSCGGRCSPCGTVRTTPKRCVTFLPGRKAVARANGYSAVERGAAEALQLLDV